jgi:ubiquinone/menaquinone biosynthesis C-methylase UbiE
MTAHGAPAQGWAAPAPSPEELKTCCASAYQHDAVALILSESYHPGGLALTRRLADSLGLKRGELVADVASGPGTTAFLLAAEYGVIVDGIDLGPAAVAAANANAVQAGVDGRVMFRVGDAERLPLDDASVDAIVCECALCTFPDKAMATAEMARVLKQGGRVGITDVTLDQDRLDPELATLAGWVACIADARPTAEYRRYLEQVGLEITLVEAHDDALARRDARRATMRAGHDLEAVARHTSNRHQAWLDRWWINWPSARPCPRRVRNLAGGRAHAELAGLA